MQMHSLHFIFSSLQFLIFFVLIMEPPFFSPGAQDNIFFSFQKALQLEGGGWQGASWLAFLVCGHSLGVFFSTEYISSEYIGQRVSRYQREGVIEITMPMAFPPKSPAALPTPVPRHLSRKPSQGFDREKSWHTTPQDRFGGKKIAVAFPLFPTVVFVCIPSPFLSLFFSLLVGH